MAVETVRRSPDGGWGWFCVLGAGIVLFLAGGAPMTFSIVLQVVMDRFRTTASQATGIYVVCVGMVLVAAPLTSALTKRFNTRVIAVCGGLLTTSGMLLASQATSLLTVYLGYGLLAGLGLSLSTVPAFVALNAFFDKKRGRAVAISGMADGIGGLVLPPVLTFMYGYYGYSGVMVAYAAVAAQCIVAGALFRPITIKSTGDDQLAETAEELRGLESYPTDSASHRDAESADIRPNGEMLMWANDEDDEDVMETKLEMGCSEADEHADLRGKGRKIESGSAASLTRNFFMIESLPYADDNGARDSSKLPSTGDSGSEDTIKPPSAGSGVKDIGELPSSDDSGMEDTSKLPSVDGSDVTHDIVSLDDPEKVICVKKGISNYHDNAVTGSMRPPLYHSRETSDISISTYDYTGTVQTTNCLSLLLDYFDLGLLKIPLFVFVSLSLGAMSVGLGAGNLFLVPYARERGFDITTMALLLSVRTGVFIVYKPLSGLAFDHRLLRRYRIEMYACLALGAGLCTLLAPFAQSQVTVYIIWLVSSFFFSWMVAQEPVVISDAVPKDKFTMAIGFGRCIRGTCSLLGNVLAGMIVDWSGSYDVAYYYGGSVLIIGSCTLHLACFLHRRKQAELGDAHAAHATGATQS